MKQDFKHNNPNISNPYQTLEQIHQGIEDYFECRLNDEQEKQLRQVLASTQYRTPQIEECIAVMGLMGSKSAPTAQLSPKVHINITQKRSSTYHKTWIAVAASILVAILIAVPLLVSNGDSEGLNKGDCYAWVGGNKITDEDLVIRMLMEDFEEFDQSVNQINDDFDSTMEYLSQIIEENENPI